MFSNIVPQHCPLDVHIKCNNQFGYATGCFTTSHKKYGVGVWVHCKDLYHHVPMWVCLTTHIQLTTHALQQTFAIRFWIFILCFTNVYGSVGVRVHESPCSGVCACVLHQWRQTFLLILNIKRCRWTISTWVIFALSACCVVTRSKHSTIQRVETHKTAKQTVNRINQQLEFWKRNRNCKISFQKCLTRVNWKKIRKKIPVNNIGIKVNVILCRKTSLH